MKHGQNVDSSLIAPLNKLSDLALLDGLLEHAPMLMFVVDLEGRMLFANRALLDWAGPTFGEYTGKSLFEVFPYEMAQQLWANDQEAQKSAEPISVEEILIHSDGSYKVCKSTRFQLHTNTGELAGTCTIAVDISDQKRHEFDALHDYLTGLANRRSFNAWLERDLSTAAREGRYFALALIDLDHFKDVNDTLGHDMGDRILLTCAASMVRAFNTPTDRCYRFGGDEFAITFSAPTSQEIMLRLKKLHTTLNGAMASELSRSKVCVTNSIGVRIVDPSSQVPHQGLMSEVDDLLYRAKRNGKNGLYAL